MRIMEASVALAHPEAIREVEVHSTPGRALLPAAAPPAFLAFRGAMVTAVELVPWVAGLPAEPPGTADREAEAVCISRAGPLP